MAILGENMKITTAGRDFIQSIVNKNFSEAFDDLSEKYKKEFFYEPEIFKLSILSLSDLSKNMTLTKQQNAMVSSINRSKGFIDFFKSNNDTKSIYYIRREFPPLPWERGETLQVSFALPNEPIGKVKTFLNQFLNHYPIEAEKMLDENKIILQKDVDGWNVSSLIMNSINITNIFLDDNHQFLSADKIQNLDLNLDELKIIVEKLKKNNVSKIKLLSFYKILLSESSRFREYLEFIEKQITGLDNES